MDLCSPHRDSSLAPLTTWFHFQVLCVAHSCRRETVKRQMALRLSLECKEKSTQVGTFYKAKPTETLKCLRKRRPYAHEWGLSLLRMLEPGLRRDQATLPSEMVYDLHTRLGPQGKQNHQVLSICPYSEPP